DPELPEVLERVFMERAQMLADAAQRSHAQDVADFVSQLDETEKQLFAEYQVTLTAMAKWQAREGNKLHQARVYQHI
ncbi:hypothetical protein EV182_002612, partial [Spiromyces aspiralis]